MTLATVPLSPSQIVHAMSWHRTVTSMVSSPDLEHGPRNLTTNNKIMLQGTLSICFAQLIKVFTFIEHASSVTVFIKSDTGPSPGSAKWNGHLQSLFVVSFILSIFSHLRLTVRWMMFMWLCLETVELPLYYMKMYKPMCMEVKKAQPFPNLDTRWGRVVRFSLRPFNPEERWLKHSVSTRLGWP
jgi:hypothetical protein